MKTSQDKLIEEYLRKGYTITRKEALELFGCFELPKRICEIQKRGVVIRKEDVKLPNGKKIKRYSIFTKKEVDRNEVAEKLKEAIVYICDNKKLRHITPPLCMYQELVGLMQNTTQYTIDQIRGELNRMFHENQIQVGCTINDKYIIPNF